MWEHLDGERQNNRQTLFFRSSFRSQIQCIVRCIGVNNSGSLKSQWQSLLYWSVDFQSIWKLFLFGARECFFSLFFLLGFFLCDSKFWLNRISTATWQISVVTHAAHRNGNYSQKWRISTKLLLLLHRCVSSCVWPFEIKWKETEHNYCQIFLYLISDVTCKFNIQVCRWKVNSQQESLKIFCVFCKEIFAAQI